jgi:hypothetical protein
VDAEHRALSADPSAIAMAALTGIQDKLALANTIVDTVRDPILVLDENLRIVAASRAFYQTFHLVDQDVLGYLVCQGPCDGRGYEVDRDFPRVGRRIMLLNARVRLANLFYWAAEFVSGYGSELPWGPHRLKKVIGRVGVRS